MSAETSHITDISGGASGTAASPKKPIEKPSVEKPQQAKRVGAAPIPTGATRQSSEAGSWPMPSLDVGKFFEDSRERLREAFDQANGRFDTVRAAARETGDVCQECHVAAISGIKDLNEHLLELAQTEVDRGYDFFKAATEVKGVSELMQLQTDYLRESMETQLDQTRALTELTMNIFKSSFAPLQTGISNVIEKARKRS